MRTKAGTKLRYVEPEARRASALRFLHRRVRVEHMWGSDREGRVVAVARQLGGTYTDQLVVDCGDRGVWSISLATIDALIELAEEG